jgi:hypothetical protein
VDRGVDLRDEIIPVLIFFQATKSHFRAGDVLLGVFKVLKLLKVSCWRVPKAGPLGGSPFD